MIERQSTSTDERSRAVDGLDNYMVGPVVEPLDGGVEDDGAGWLVEQVRAAVSRSFAAGMAAASAVDSRAAVRACEEYHQMRRSAFWLVAASLSEPPEDPLAGPDSDPADRLPAGSYDRAPKARQARIVRDPQRARLREGRLDALRVGKILKDRPGEPGDGAGWLATHAQDAVDNAFASGIRVSIAKDPRTAAAAVQQYERAHRSCNLIGSLASPSPFSAGSADTDNAEQHSADTHTVLTGTG